MQNCRSGKPDIITAKASIIYYHLLSINNGFSEPRLAKSRVSVINQKPEAEPTRKSYATYAFLRITIIFNRKTIERFKDFNRKPNIPEEFPLFFHKIPRMNQ